jgi:site-specific recombinase XerC
MQGCHLLRDDDVALVSMSLGGICTVRDKALFLLGIKSNFRISELLPLRVGDVYQHNHVVDRVTVQRRHLKRQTKGCTLLLHPEAKAALEVWLHQLQGESTLLPTLSLFHSRKGTNRPISQV